MNIRNVILLALAAVIVALIAKPLFAIIAGLTALMALIVLGVLLWAAADWAILKLDSPAYENTYADSLEDCFGKLMDFIIPDKPRR
jgi:hypothetical protein